MTAYTQNHTAAEIAGIVIDFIVEIGIQWVALAALIAVVGIFVWVRSQKIL